jgi:hypothetical protein
MRERRDIAVDGRAAAPVFTMMLVMPAEGLEPPTNGLQSTDLEFCGLIFQPLAALASPVPRPTTAQLRHSQSGLGSFPA